MFRVSVGVAHRLDDIYVYTRERWGEAQAERYIRGLFERFDDIAQRRIPWRAIPAEFGVDGFVCRYERHFIYWRPLQDGAVGIVTICTSRCTRWTGSGRTFPAERGFVLGTPVPPWR